MFFVKPSSWFKQLRESIQTNSIYVPNEAITVFYFFFHNNLYKIITSSECFLEPMQITNLSDCVTDFIQCMGIGSICCLSQD